MQTNCDFNSLTRSWAGGDCGRKLIDQFVENSFDIISENGVVYLLIIKENKPQEVIDNMMKKGFKACHKVMERKCKNECLMVLRFSKHIIKHS